MKIIKKKRNGGSMKIANEMKIIMKEKMKMKII